MEGNNPSVAAALWSEGEILEQSILALGVATLQPRLACFSAIFIQPHTSHIHLSFVTLKSSSSPCPVRREEEKENLQGWITCSKLGGTVGWSVFWYFANTVPKKTRLMKPAGFCSNPSRDQECTGEQLIFLTWPLPPRNFKSQKQ